jgi:hypothetical protein
MFFDSNAQNNIWKRCLHKQRDAKIYLNAVIRKECVRPKASKRQKRLRNAKNVCDPRPANGKNACETQGQQTAKTPAKRKECV